MGGAAPVTAVGGDDVYAVPVLAKLLHALPHVNVTMHPVNSTFDPRSPVYLESLGILGSIPAAWLILTLLILLIYLLTRCCDRKPRPARSIAALKATLAVISVLCCAALGLGLYGNDDVHNGISQFINEGYQIDQLVAKIRNQTQNMHQQLYRQAGTQLTQLRDVFDSPVQNATAIKYCIEQMDHAITNNTLAYGAAKDIRSPLDSINLRPQLDILDTVEWWRWPATMGVLSALLVLCVILLVGVARHSRCALIAFSVCGLLAVIASYVMASVYLAGTVALSDLCMAPDRYVEDEAGTDGLVKEILRYYTSCERARANPFTQRLREAKNAIENERKALNVLKRPAMELFPRLGLEPKFSLLLNQVNEGDVLLTSLTAMVDCRTLHGHYLRGARSLCNVALWGWVLMLGSSILAGLLFTVLVWVDSHTWIYIRKRKDYQQVTETDPYLPPPAASQAIAARTLQRSQGSASASASPSCSFHAPDDTPPPSYTSAMLHARPPTTGGGSGAAPSAPLLPLPPALHDLDDHDHALMDGCDMRSSELLHHHQHHRAGSAVTQGMQQQQQGGGGAQMSHLLRGHTLGRLPSHHHQQQHHHGAHGAHHGHHDGHHHGAGPNNGKYATLSKQCKTLESSDFY